MPMSSFTVGLLVSALSGGAPEAYASGWCPSPLAEPLLHGGGAARGADQLGPRLTASPFSSHCYPRRPWGFGGHPRGPAPASPRALRTSLAFGIPLPSGERAGG